MPQPDPQPIRKSLLPCTPPPEWEFSTALATGPADQPGLLLVPSDAGPVVVRRRVTYGDWEPVHPDRWADEPPSDVRAAAPAGPAPATDGGTLRERIAEALLDHLSRTADIRTGRTGELAFMPEITDSERIRIAEHLAAELPAPTGLSESERTMLTYALDQAQEQIWVSDGFTVEDQAALNSLRRLAGEALPSSTAPLAAGLPHVQGRCPACGTAGLFLGHGGYVTCSRIDCPEPDAASTLLERTREAQQDEAPGQWCKCRSCWGWFIEEHPGEDLDELGRDLSWWSGLPEHRDAPAGVAQQEPTQDGEARHTGGNAEDCPVCRPEIDKTVLYPWECPGA